MKNRNLTYTIILSVLVCFAVLPKTKAVTPTPDGCYAGYNTAEGCNALHFLTAGLGNTGLGWYSLYVDTIGSFNTGVGGGALALNNGTSNTAVGAGALLLNTTGDENTAIGTNALVFNDSGSGNSSFGAFANINNIAGNNTAIGARTLLNNTSGDSNTAIGHAALLNNDSGSNNVAIGVQALGNNTSGSGNIAIGNVSGTGVTTANGVICIGNVGGVDVDNTTFISGIWGVATQFGNAIPVLVDEAGQLGTVSSSQRFKKDIQAMGQASEAILALKPVTFEYKSDKMNTPQFGLIAEEVEKVAPALVVRDTEGKPFTVRYDQVNAMLLNEFLKEHKKVEGQQAKIESQEAAITDMKSTIAQQRERMEVLTTQLKEQSALIQKVSAQLELNKPATKTVLNIP
jgi:Chaperone of endosialidase